MSLPLPPLRLGLRSPEVGNWQRFLNASMDARLSTDEAFGAKTLHATKTWQLANKLVIDGVVGPASRAIAVPQGFVQFLQARNFTPVNERQIDLVLIHDMEYPETPQGAEWCAAFFAAPNAPRASAHYSIDSDSIVQSVRESDVAWHAPGANHNGLGIEHAGYARQTRAQWLDVYSRAQLALSAKLVARLCSTYGIPILWVDPDGLRAGERGITGHRDVSMAFGRSSHWDPGPNFPQNVYLDLVRATV